VEETDPPAALVLWWRPIDESGEEGELTRVAFLLEVDEGGTRLRVVESRPLSRLDARGIELPASRRALGGQARGPLALVG